MARYIPQVINFNISSIFTDEDIQKMLDIFPENHIKNIKAIRYIDRYNIVTDYDELVDLLSKGLNITGQWSIDEITKEETIEIFRQSEYGNIAPFRMKEDIAHEIGHSVFNHLSREKKNIYNVLWQNSSVPGYSTRTINDLEEDFCYTYSNYFTNHHENDELDSKKVEFIQTLQLGD